MRLISIVLIISSLALPVQAQAEARTKRVCHVDENTKKESCKNIRIHHKAEKVTKGSPTDPVKKDKK